MLLVVAPIVLRMAMSPATLDYNQNQRGRDVESGNENY
jgi:hypothetical protein